MLSAKVNFAQKTLNMKVIEVTNTPGTDCDDIAGICNGSEWEWLWQGGVSSACHEIDNSSANVVNPDKTLWGTNSYWSADCWPSGSISVTFYGQEDDGVSNCDIESGAPSSTNAYSYPAATAATGNVALANPVSVTAASGAFGCACGGNVSPVFTYKSRWEIGGAYSGSNLDVNGYTNNKTCATAIDIDGGTEATGTRVTTAVNQCTDAWYIYDVTSTNLSSITFDGATGYVRIYTGGSGGSCGTLFQVAEGSNGASVKDPEACRYYIRIEAAGGRTNLNVSKAASGYSNDFICHANNLGTMPSGGGTLQLNSENNLGSWAETSEPNVNTSDNDYRTDWYKFTTGATVPSKVDIGVEENGDNIDADFRLYKLNDNAYTVPCRCAGVVNWSKLTSIADGDGGDNVACVGSYNSYLNAVCIDPNSTYYIQVRGYQNGGLCANEDDGNFRVYVTGSTTAKGPDDICSAVSLTSSLPINYNSGNINFNNDCDGVQAGEPHTTSGNRMHNTAWYSFTTPATNVPPSVTVEIQENGSGANNSAIAVYQSSGGCTFGALTEKAFNWWCNSSGGTISFDCLSPNTTYFIQAGTAYNSNDGVLCALSSESTGDYYIRVTTPDIVAGADDICNAENLGTLSKNTVIKPSGDKVQTNRCATNNTGAGEVNNPNSGNETVWYKFTTGATIGRFATIKILSQSSSYINADFRLYKDPSSGTCNYTDLQQNYWFQDGQVSCIGNTFMDATYDQLCLEPSTTYYIQVFGSNPGGITACGGYDVGNFKVEVSYDNITVPVNDRICGAKNIAVQTAYTYNSSLLSAETNINGTDCFDPQPDWAELGKDNDYGVWYYIGQVPGRTMVVDANSLSGDNIDLELALYSSTSNSCNAALTEVQKEYAGAGTFWDEDAYFNCLDVTKYYWLLVDGSDVTGTGIASALEQGNFSIRTWFPEEGETTFCNAENIGTVPNGGNVTKLNLANKCGVASGTFGTSGTFTLPSGFTLDNAVVYKFTTPASGSIQVEATTNPYYPGQMGLLTGDEIDLQLAVFEKQGAVCSTANYFPKGNNYDATDGFNENLIVNCLSPNTEYYLMVDGSGLNGSGYYDIKISDYGVSTPNDLLCNATAISGTYSAPWSNCNNATAVSITGQNNYCATITNDLPSSLGGIPSTWSTATSGVWYKFIAPKSGKLTIAATNTYSDIVPPYDEPEISAQLAIFFLPGGYQGNCASVGTEKDRLQFVASDHDGLLHDEDFTVECLMPDSTYYILVDGTSETLCPTCDRGEFYLTLTPDPRDRPSTNDLPCNAINLGTPIYNTTIVDTKVPPASGAATNPSPTTGYPGTSGLYAVGRGTTGNCMRAENNFCSGTAGEPAVSGGTFLTDFSADATVWYKFTAPATGEVLISAYNDPNSLGDQIDLQLALYESDNGLCSGTLVPIKAEYNVGSFDEDMTVKCLNPGQTYWLMVDGSGLNTRGYFEVQVRAVPATQSGPANDDICNATNMAYPGSVGASTALSNQTNRCATIQTIYSEPTTFTKDADVWYKFTTPSTAGPHAVEVNVTSGLPWPFGDAMDPQIALYKMNPTTGPCATSFNLVDDQYSAAGLPFTETMEFHCLEANTTYYLMVDGSGLNEQGNFNVTVKRINPHPLATNDNICSVGTTTANGYLGMLGSTTGNKVGNTSTNWHNFCSTVEINENSVMTDGAYSLDQTVWFHFKTPNVANNVNVQIRGLNDPNNVGDQIDLQMLLVQGNPSCPSSASTFSTLTPIESADPALSFNATIDVCLPPNQDFYIQVDGSGLNKQGYFTIEVENMGTTSAPTNDNICNAKTLPSGGTITGSFTGYTNDNNICATLESSEVQHTASSVQRSVWYKYTCPASADITVQVVGNSFIPFTTNYFLPDVNIWEVNDGTTSVGGTCVAPTWTKLSDNWHQDIPNSLANGIYPTVNLTPLCLKPGYTYYVQVDGVAGIGIDGYFDIKIKDNQTGYVGPTNNECAGATTLTVGPKSCQVSGGTWSTLNYGDPTWSRNPGGCTADCGDIWYKFVMPAACGNNTQSFVKIEGNDEMGTLGITNSNLAVAAYRGSCGALSYIKCNTGGSGGDPDFSISGTPGETIYLQVWEQNGDDFGKDFQLCVSEQKSADDCNDATAMTLDLPYCFSVAASGGETANSAVIGSGLKSYCGSGDPQHSTYFKFTTDATTNFCDDYYMYINLQGIAKEITGAALQNCFGGTSPTVEFTATIWETVSGGNLCTPGATNVTQRDCYTFNDCGTGSFGSNVSGPHGNGGVINDTVWFNNGTGFSFSPNKTYYIVLDYRVLNSLQFSGRTIADGVIEIGRRCKGRVWEYTTAPLVTTSNYCTSSDGWQHYYDDKGTPSTVDDKYILSIYPNGNNIKGTAKVYLNNNYYSYLDIPNRYAEYVMRRRWDFVLTPGFNTINPANPVKVRFYYQNVEKQEIITAAQNFATTYACFYEDFEWFKSANGHEFDVVTDVNPKVISVGPNGYSETGCVSYWTAAGVFVGPPGIQRCIQKTITDWDDGASTHEWCNGIHFAEYTGLTGFSGGTGGAGASPWDVSPLPVELTSFTGYNNGSINVLNWTTASEKNTLKFEVERKSTTNNNFTYIGEKPAAGNSSSVINYTLNDENPLLGDNFYRLKIIDLDGTYQYSQIIVVNNKENDNYKDLISRIYPNPANQMLYIDYQSSSSGNIKLKVFDALGQEMLTDNLATRKGNQQFKIDVSNFAIGVYIINIQDESTGKILQTKFVKE